MFIPIVMVIKMSKMAHLFVYFANDSEKSVIVWANYLNAFERSYLALLKIAMDYWVLSYH